MLRRLWTLPAVVESRGGVSIPKLLMKSGGTRQHNTIRKELSRETELVAGSKTFASTVQNGGCYALCKGSGGADNTILSKCKIMSTEKPAEENKETWRSAAGRLTEIKYHFFQPNGKNPNLFASSLISPPLSTIIHGLPSAPTPFMEARRGIIKYSLLKGRRKTARAVKNRFLRLDWGGWISAQPGRNKKAWKRHPDVRPLMLNHVLRKASEVKLLDKMVTKYWIKKKYFVDDPYESYHKRDDFPVAKGVEGVKSTNLYKMRHYTKKINPSRKPLW